MTNIFDELRSALFSVWNRRWLALAVAWGVCLLGWLAVATVPNSYESRARVYVQLDDALADKLGIGGDRRRDVERVRQTLTSAVNLEKVVRATRIGEDIKSPKQMEATVLGLAKAIKVVSQESNLFEISASSGNGSYSDAENAKLAQDIVQKMIDIFREENLTGRSGEMNETVAFLDKQLADRQKELDDAQQRRSAFEAQHPDMVQGGVAGVQRLESARSELRGIDADLVAAQSALAAINGQLAGTPQTIAGSGPSGGARAALGQAMADLAAMRARGLTDNHPDVIALRNQVSSLRAQAQSEGNGGVSGMPNPAYSSLVSIKAERQANVQGLQARRAAVQADLAQLSSLRISSPELATEAQRITRDYDVLKQQYDKILKDREELLLRGKVETERSSFKIEVTDPPTSPRAPAAPNRPLLLLAVLVLGLGAGVGVALALAQLRSTFSTSSKLERAIGLPVLGAISQARTEKDRKLRTLRLKQFYAATGALFGIFILLLVAEIIQVGMVA